jgi:hypothetical protein
MQFYSKGKSLAVTDGIYMVTRENGTMRVRPHDSRIKSLYYPASFSYDASGFAEMVSYMAEKYTEQKTSRKAS